MLVDPSDMHRMKRSKSGEVKVVLVHGTFARNALWIKEGSKLRHAIQESIPNPIHFIDFEWSGSNSFKARRGAASELGVLLDKAFDENPKAAIIIIGHSHGGNVALKALDCCRCGDSVAGIVCLSTPFLVCRERHFAGLKFSSELAFIPLLGVGVFLFYTKLYPRWREHAVVGIIATLAFLFCVLIAAVVIMSWSESRQEKATQLKFDALPVSLLRNSAHFRERLLIVRHAGDEASGGLGAAMFFSWIMSYCFGLLHRAWGRSDTAIGAAMTRLPKWFWVIVGIAVTALLYIDTAHEKSFWIAGLVALWGGYNLVKVFISAFKDGTLRQTVLGIAMLILSPLFGILGLAFGPELLLLSIWSEVTVEWTPLGRWELLLLERPTQDIEAGLTHSAAYDDPAALESVKHFMRRIVSITARPGDL
jgi:pimeloyl-ACP methyl ester carboxylesterase